jgi:hypothetical protein
MNIFLQQEIHSLQLMDFLVSDIFLFYIEKHRLAKELSSKMHKKWGGILYLQVDEYPQTSLSL